MTSFAPFVPDSAEVPADDYVPDFSPPSDEALRPYIEEALREDLRSGDVTSQALIRRGATASATMNARAEGVVCGVDLARLAFRALDPGCRIEILAPDGSHLRPDRGAAILQVSGSARAILSAERVALNYAQRLSGVATLTRRFVEAVEGTGARVVDTRKTTPLLRLLEKYAVRCGGGRNHRFALDDMILVKDNHIALCGGVAQAISRARAHASHAVKVEVECDALEQVEEAARCGADVILLDNMAPEQMAQAVALARAAHPHVLLEASGGITLETARAKAQSGVDILSVGALTHSAPALDIGLDIDLHL
jgi:nicotinate-nucleotide pyrophosphorylase (carboxylating)